MDNENTPPHSEHAEGDSAHAPAANGDAATPDPAAVIEQVRELLFGEHRRATEGSLKHLEDRLAALTATVEARFADLERRVHESRAEADRSRDHHVEAIGAALTELGERLKSLVAKPPA
jgi:hypothetical protein